VPDVAPHSSPTAKFCSDRCRKQAGRELSVTSGMSTPKVSVTQCLSIFMDGWRDARWKFDWVHV
jgi:hypothetical protein